MYVCSNDGCDNEIEPKRYELGYRTCLECGTPQNQHTVAIAYHKGPYMFVSRKNVKDIGRG